MTGPLLRDGGLDPAIAQDPAALRREALRAAGPGPEGLGRAGALLDFAVYTRFNLPAFGRPDAAPAA